MTGPGGIALRAAVPADAPGVTALARAAKARWGYPAAWLDAWGPELEMTAEYLSEHRAWCAEEGEVLVGFCSLEDVRGSCELGFLWVDPGHQGKGIGRALVDCARGHVPAGREVRVLSDPNAVGFYERMGAVRVGAVPAPMPGAPERELPLLALSR